MKILKNINLNNRQHWLKKTIENLEDGLRILDAGAGELQNRKYCKHLDYISQDFCQYNDNSMYQNDGLQSKSWDTSKIDIVSDINSIPLKDASIDVILCSEVLEHIPDPTCALDEFSRLLKPDGKLILTAPFSSNVHMAPYFFCTGFSKYWYEHHLSKRNFLIEYLQPNGDWFGFLRQEITRLGGVEKTLRSYLFPFAYFYSLIGLIYFSLRSKKLTCDHACFGFHCIAKKNN